MSKSTLKQVGENTLTARPSTKVKGQVIIDKAGLFMSVTFEFGMTVLWDGGESVISTIQLNLNVVCLMRWL